MDAWAGELIRELKEAGEYEKTIIFFWSDHGVGLPRAKRWLYDSGTHIPLVARIPEKFRKNDFESAGTVTNRLVSSNAIERLIISTVRRSQGGENEEVFRVLRRRQVP